MKKIITFLYCFIYLAPCVSASLPVDDFEDADITNLSGSNWTKYTDGFSEMSFEPDISPGHDGSRFCARIIFKGIAGSNYQFAGVTSNLHPFGSQVDLSPYEGIRFWARGTGNLEVHVPVTATQNSYNHYLTSVTTGSNWQLYELSFKELVQTWGEKKPFDLATATAVQFNVSGTAGIADTFYIDRIEFFKTEEYIAPPQLINPFIKINQEGYLPFHQKEFIVSLPFAKEGSNFYVISIPDSSVAYTGILGKKINDLPSTGEEVLTGNFSGFHTEGNYFILTDSARSLPFRIGHDIYHSLFRDALRTFYVNRCGTEINDEYSGINHGVCHAQDTLIRQSDEIRDFTGAWHNAGDFGKWTNLNAINVSYFLTLYDWKKNSVKQYTSDLLSEAKWGIQWLLKMQNPDGSVYHKVDTEPYFAVGKSPDKDTLKRFASFQKASHQTPSSIDAACFTAALAHASRTFRELDPEYAELCRTAAIKTWNWLRNNTLTGQNDPFYIDSVYSQELLWAKAEMYCLLHDPGLLAEIMQDIISVPLEYIGWLNPQAFGYISVFSDSSADHNLKEKMKTQVVRYADNQIGRSDKSGYGVAMQPEEYYWGSNEAILSKGNMMLMASWMSGEAIYRNYALKQLNYILGKNSLNLSFVTGHGQNAVKRPYHWGYLSDNKVLKGWPSGGANQYPWGVDALLLSRQNLKLPPAKCFTDGLSYGSNEGQTTEAGALMLLSGFFFDESFPLNVMTGSMEQKQVVPFVFTNPVKDLLKLEHISNQAELVISNVTNTIMYNGSYIENGIILPDSLPDGMYFVSVSDRKTTTHLKFVLKK